MECKTFLNIFRKAIADSKKSTTFATQSREIAMKKLNGALVQLVRIHACHAWGHGFESRTHREKKSWFILNQDFLFHISGKIKKREHAVLGTFPSIV